MSPGNKAVQPENDCRKIGGWSLIPIAPLDHLQ